MRRLAFIGHSHMHTMKKAVEAPGEQSFSGTFTSLKAFDPVAEPVPAELAKLLDRVCAGAAAVCLQVKGNQHTAYGLLRQSPEFDIVVSKEPDLALVPGAEIVPQAAFAAFFERSLAGLPALIRHLKSKAGAPVIVFGPPPPIEDSAFLLSTLDPYFVERLEEQGVPRSEAAIAAPLVRWKVWHILDKVYEKFAQAEGAIWLPAPADAFHNERFLHPNAWGADATHANAWYGELRLRQIETVLQ